MTGSDVTELELPLAQLRVIEAGDTIAAAYAGRLLWSLGADVVKCEPVGGDVLRHVGPFPDGRPDPEASVSFAYYHGGKHSLLLSEVDDRQLAELLGRADILLRSTRSGEDLVTDEQLADAERRNPGLIVVDISARGGATGDRSLVDLLALATSGLLSLNDRSGPLRYRGELACIHAGCDGVLAALGALHARDRTGLGQRIDISAHAAVNSILATAVAEYGYTGSAPRRDAIQPIAPWGYYRCADGVVLIQVTQDSQWVAFKRVLGEPEWARDPRYDENASRITVHEEIDRHLEPEIARFTVADFLAACDREGVAATHVHTAADVLTWRQLEAREFLHERAIAAPNGRAVLPGIPWRFARTPGPARHDAPRLGSARADELVAAWSRRRLPAGIEPDSSEAFPEPLDDCRILDLTWVWAGPFAAMQFAHLGAEVIKVESTERVDVTRVLAPFADGVSGVDRSGYFNVYNQGKRSITVDVKQEPGMELVRQLLQRSQLVIDNMRPGALARMGLSPETIRALAPSAVAVALTGFGETGPESGRMAYGSIIDALAGVAAANGRPGGDLAFFPMSLPDPCAGVHAAIAGVAALLRARRTGEGDRVEVSMAEATLAAFPWPVLIEGSGQGPVALEGNRDPTMSPHGVFPCAGEDRWVAIAVLDDSEFAALATCMGRGDLVTDPRFRHLANRKANEDALERIIEDWTSRFDRDELAECLRRAGVRAAPVLDVGEALDSPDMTARQFVVRLPHAEVGERPLPGTAWVATRSSMRPVRAAPCLGADTVPVLRDVLGLASERIDGLQKQGVLQ